MIEEFEHRGWSHELFLLTRDAVDVVVERTNGEPWYANGGEKALIGVKFEFDSEKGHYTQYAKFGQWVAFQTDKSTGEQIRTVLNEAFANHLMDSARVGRRKHVPNRVPPRG